MLCKQDNVHESMVDNPLGFIVFYVFSNFVYCIFISTFTKRYSKKKRKKKINTLSMLIFILFCIHSFLIIVVLNIAKVFNIKKIGLIRLKDSKIKFYIFYIVGF